MSTFPNLLEEAAALLPEAIRIRREIHAHPELGLDLPVTQQVILRELDGLGYAITTGQSLTSVTAVLDSGRPGPTVLLRADMDALPLQEDADVDFASRIEGAMHACGHDAHVAMLLAAARLLADRKDELKGRVVLMFQPGEEGGGGADIMIHEGVLEAAGTSTDLAFAIHVTPVMPNGMVGSRGGTIMASSDEFTIDIVGKGGHASQPHAANDPITIAAELVMAIQSMVTRKINAFDPAVVTVAHLTAGTTSNVIPERAQLHGTIRTVSAFTRQYVREQLTTLAQGIAAAHGAVADVNVRLGYPVTVNSDLVAMWAKDVVGKSIGEAIYLELPAPVMGAEDFSYVLEKVPGVMVFLGLCPEGVNFFEAAPNHSNRMVLNETGMTTGIALYTAVALTKSQES
jgi:hippurate hydrolase